MTYTSNEIYSSNFNGNINNNDEIIRVGTIGLSLENSWAIKTHYPSIQQLSSHFQITALYNENIGVSIQTIRGLKLEHATAFPTLETFILSSNIDMIIFTLHGQKYDDILVELLSYCRQLNDSSKIDMDKRRLKYILFDWPINCAIEQVELVVNETSVLGIQTIISLQGRKSPYVMRAKELISEGSIGEINSIEIAGNGAWYGYERSVKSPDYLFNYDSGSDLVTNAFAHTIDVVQYITGSYFSQINSMIFNNIPEQDLVDENGNKTGEKIMKSVPDHLLFQGKLLNGNVPVSCSFKGGKPTKKFTKNLVIDIHGTKGDIKLEGDAGFVEMSNLVLYYSGMKVNEIHTSKGQVIYDAGKEVMEFYHLRNYNALFGNIFRLYQSIMNVHIQQLEQENPPQFIIQTFQSGGFPTLADGLVLYRLIKAAFKSNMLGSTLDVSNICS